MVCFLGVSAREEIYIKTKGNDSDCCLKSAVNNVCSKKHFVMLRFLLNIRQVF